MALEFEGDFEVDRSRDEVYAFLTDPEEFAPLLPDFQDLDVHEDGSFTVKVKVGVSHIQGTATVDMELVEDNPPERAVFEGTGSVVGGSVDLHAGFSLEETAGGGTRVIWQGNPEVSGRIVSVAGGLLKPLAQKNIQKAIDSLQNAMEG